jgi:hypothetical protein
MISAKHLMESIVNTVKTINTTAPSPPPTP